ncbi:MAG: transglycosylase SLT domain-containing protein [Acidobacteriota bacterium]
MNSLDAMIDAAAKAHGLPAGIVAAIVQVESSANTFAARYEPDYPYLWNVSTGKAYRVRPAERSLDRAPADFSAPRGVSVHTEWISQQTSYGLMQVMGAVARELGFAWPFLTQLCDPSVGMEFGCRLLAKLKRTYLAKYGWEGVLRGYNGGPGAVVNVTNPEYPAKIKAAMGGAPWPV